MRLQIFSRQPDFFVSRQSWWCLPPGVEDTAANWRDRGQDMAVDFCRLHSDKWIAKFTVVNDRDAAAAWNGGLAAVEYEQLPALVEDSFYWCDLIGMQVDNTAGERLGVVASMTDIGAHDLLRVQTPQGQILIPFVDKHVITVDMQKRLIIADWQLDW